MGRAARAKGNRYEAQIASDFRDWGFKAITARNMRGGYQGDEDVVVHDYWIFVECKAQERGSLHQWMHRMIEKAKPGWLRVLFWKRDCTTKFGGEYIIMPKADFEKLWREGCDPWWKGQEVSEE